jgi:hypothetical protein
MILDPTIGSRGFASKKLVPGSKEFDPKAYKRKMSRLKRGLKAIKDQKTFNAKKDNNPWITLFILSR